MAHEPLNGEVVTGEKRAMGNVNAVKFKVPAWIQVD